jgi:O-antigen/teichoic acid export membrane protein
LSEASNVKTVRRPTPLSAGGWAMFSFALTYVGAALLYIPLARLLERSDVGLFGVATLVSSALSLMIELTLIKSLVRMPGDRNELATATFRLSILFGLAGATLCALSGPALALFYGSRLENSAKLYFTQPALALGVLSVALGAVPHALLSRELNFKRKLIPETISVGVASVAAIIAAFLGAGVFALVLYQAGRAVLSATIAWLIVGWRPSKEYKSLDSWRKIFRFSLPTVGGEFALYARFNVDYAIASLRVGADSLGLYLLAYNTSDRPALLFNSFFGQVGFATFSRLQQFKERLQRILLSATRVLAGVALPVYTAAILIRQELAVGLFGANGRGMPEVLLPLLLFQVLWVVFYPSAALTLALGHNRLYAAINITSLVLTVIALFIGVNYGIEGVAWSVLIVAGVTQLVWFRLACQFTAVSFEQIVKAFRLPMLFAAATGVTGALALFVMGTIGFNNLNFPPEGTRQSIVQILTTDAFIRLLGASGAMFVVLAALIKLNWGTIKTDFLTLREQLPEEELMEDPALLDKASNAPPVGNWETASVAADTKGDRTI